MHHVLADGIGGLAVLAELVDTDVDDTREPNGAPRRDASHARPRRLDPAAVGAPLGPEHASWFRRRPARARWYPSPNAGRTSLLHPTSPRRRIEIVEVDLAAIVAAAHAKGATVNDLLLAAVSGALRRLLAARDEQLDEVLISVPVSGRPATSSADLGNQVGVLPVAVPLAEDPAVRLAAVRDQRARLGTSAPRASSGAVLSVLFRGLAAGRDLPVVRTPSAARTHLPHQSAWPDRTACTRRQPYPPTGADRDRPRERHRLLRRALLRRTTADLSGVRPRPLARPRATRRRARVRADRTQRPRVRLVRHLSTSR